MEYKEFGKTGKRISRLAFGGMRFENPEDVSGSAEVVLAAREEGVNYFDTAPNYCRNMSEKIMGEAIRQMGAPGENYFVSTKTSKSSREGVRADLETSLENLGVDRIDFYHCWYILTLEGWEARKASGAVDELLKARDEGLIGHAVFSTHLDGEEMKAVIGEGIFEGVTLGYNAVNFPYRQQGVRAAGEAGLGVVVMNPLGGGVIPQNPDNFSFIRTRDGQGMVSAALEFLWWHDHVTAALVGFRNTGDVREAARAWKNFDPAVQIDLEEMKSHVEKSFDRLCTGCRYCRDCPEDIEVYKYMEAYNHIMLSGGESLHDRLKWHYAIESLDDLERCTECGQCVDACTQHLPILERFQELKEAYAREG